MTDDDLLKVLARLKRLEQAMQRVVMIATVREFDAGTNRVRLDLGADPSTGERLDNLWTGVQTLGNRDIRIRITPRPGQKMFVVSPGGRPGAHSIACHAPFNDEDPAASAEAEEVRIDVGDETSFLLRPDRIEARVDACELTLSADRLRGRIEETEIDLVAGRASLRQGDRRLFATADTVALMGSDDTWLHVPKAGPPLAHAPVEIGPKPEETP